MPNELKSSSRVSVDLAHRLLEVFPKVMSHVRFEMRSSASPELSVPQFRTLLFIRRGITRVGKIAIEQGISQPAMSKMVDGLVKRKLILRQVSREDRRQYELSLTKKGHTLFSQIKRQAEKNIGRRIAQVDDLNFAALGRGLEELEKIFS